VASARSILTFPPSYNDPERAEHLARRALAVDEWSESAYAILVTAALGRGERSAAVRILEQCATMLATLGVEPSEPTRRLIRRVQLGPDVPAARD
jgi:DNA-binding SARP family transcriptional activator